MKKNGLIVCSLLVLVLLLAACSGGNNTENANGTNGTNEEVNNANNNESTGNTESDEGESSFKLAEPTTVTMLTMDPNYNKNWLVYDNIFEATNIRIEGQLPAGNYADALALTMAGGDIPDIIYMNSNQSPKQYGSQGALIDFNEHLDKMPNLKKFWEERPDLKERATTHDGKTYQTVADGLAYTNHLVWMYREDIFEEHNIDVPATWDELYEVLKQLKELYPDSHPLTFRDRFGTIDHRMLPSFGLAGEVRPDLESREVIYGQVQDEYRDMIGYLNTFYQERLMNQDFLSITAEQWVELMTTGRAFVTLDYIGRMQSLTDAMVEEGAQMAMMPPPAGGEREAYVRNMSYMPGGFTVFKNTPNLDAALHYIDFLFSDEGSELVSWGKEGETYDIVDGERKLIVGNDHLELRIETGMAGFGNYGKFDSEATKSLLPEEYRPYYDEVEPYVYPEDIISSFTEEEEGFLAMTEEQLTKHKETMVSRFIIGDRSLDEWDQYVQEMERIGLSNVIETYKTSYERQGIN